MHRYGVLGELRVDDDPGLTPRRPAQRRLLALLVLRRDAPVGRDDLIDELWAQEPPSGAVNTLQAHVSGLRRLLGRDAVVTEARGYQLAAGPDDVDVDVFDEHLQRARALRATGEDLAVVEACDGALALWRGQPYVDLTGHPGAEAEAHRLEEARVAARALRVAAWLDLGRWHEAADELDRLLADHPHRERLWELLMLARYRCGRTADALAAYRSARTALGELGLDPGRALRELERRVLVQDPGLMVASATSRGDGTAATDRAARQLDHGVHAWPLVDREEEVARLRGVLDGRSRGAVLVGPSGVGKSRLLHEVARRARDELTVVVVRANQSLEHIPFGAVSDLARLAPAPVTAQLQQLLEVLGTLGDPVGPPLLLVDDAHHLDASTLALLVRALQTDQVRVVATVRDDLPVPPAVTHWWKDLGLQRVEVGPLGVDHVHTLLEQVLGRIDGASRQRLVDVVAGNPLHLREMLRAAREDGALVHAEGRWALVREVVGAARLTELVEGLVRGLSRRSRAGLEVLALARPVVRAVVDAIAGDGAVDDLQLLGLVRLEAVDGVGVVVDVSHPLHAENLATRMSVERRRELGARVAAELEAHGFPLPGDVLLASALAMEAGALGPDLAIRASRLALVAMDAELARRLADVAVRTTDDAEAWLLRGRADAYLGRFTESEQALMEAQRRATPDQLVQVDSERAAALAFGQRDAAAAIAILDDALRSTSEPPQAARLRIERALYLAMTGRMSEVLVEAEALRATPLPPPARLSVGIGETLARVLLGQLDGLEDELTELDRLAAELRAEFPLASQQLTYQRIEHLVGAGRVDEAVVACEAWGEQVRGQGGLHTLWHATSLMVLGAAGRVTEGLALDDEEAATFVAAPDPFQVQLLRPCLRALLLAQAGRLPAARRELESVDPAGVRADPRTAALWRQAQAWACLPDQGRAADAFALAGRLGTAQGHLAWAVHGWYGAVRVGRADQVVDALAEAARSTRGGVLVGTLAASAAAHAADDLDGIVDVAGRLERHGARLLAAEAWTRAEELATTQGREDVRGRAGAEAERLAAGLGADTPALRRVPVS